MHLRQIRFAPSFFMGVLAVLVASAGLQAQTQSKPRNIFDDDPTPPPGMTTPGAANPNGARPAAPVAAPAAGMVPGLICTVYAGETLQTPEREHFIAPHVGIAFDSPAANGFLSGSFSFRGSINIPFGGAAGVFHFDTTGEYDVAIDGQIVTSLRAGDPANSFEHQVNLAQGLHTLTASIFHLRPNGAARQNANLFWRPLAGVGRTIRDWCWHARADEPADASPLRAAGAPNQTNQNPAAQNPPGAATAGWVRAGTPRPPNDEGPADQVLPGFVVELWFGEAFQNLTQFTVLPIAGFNFTVNKPGAMPGGYQDGSFKVHGTLNLQADSQCIFDCRAPGQVEVSVDNNIVMRGGIPGQVPMRQPVALRAGIHVYDVAVSRVIADIGKHAVGLGWSLNGQAFVGIPDNVIGHYRSQEPYMTSGVAAAAAAARPAGASTNGFPPGTGALPPPRVTRLPIPDPDAQARTIQQLRQRIPAWNDPGSAQQADYLIKAADQSRDDAVASYVLLDKARTQAQVAAAIPLAFRAIDMLAAQFNVDAPRLKSTVLLAQGTRRATDFSSRAALLDVYNQAIAADNYPVAVEVANMALADARHQNLAPDIAAATQRLTRAVAANGELEKVKPMLVRLTANPNDAEANLAAGRFYCFTARNFERGAAALARCNDPVLSWLGRREGSAGQGAAAQLALANGWWDAADGQNETVAAAMRERAAQWYRQAAPALTGLSGRLALRRAAKIPSAAGLPSPLAAPAPSAPPQQTVASAPFAPASGQAPVVPPVQGKPWSPNNPGPFVMVVDRAMVAPHRIFSIMGRISAECKWSEPTAAVTVIVADTPPQIFHGIAGEMVTNNAPPLADIERALRATPAASSLEVGINTGLTTLPRRLMILTDLNFPANPILAVINARDPGQTTRRYVQFWCTYEERDAGRQKMSEVLSLYHGGGGLSPDFKRQ
jgi:hypothetical protein